MGHASGLIEGSPPVEAGRGIPVVDSFEMKPHHGPGMVEGVVAVLDSFHPPEPDALQGRSVVIRVDGVHPVWAKVEGTRDHGTTTSVLLTGVKRDQVPVGSTVEFRSFAPARRIPSPAGDIVRGLVTYQADVRAFRIATGIGDDTYDIEADRILTHKAFTDWVWHLQTKGWMTGQHFADLFACLSEFIYRQWGEWPQTFYAVENAGSEGMDRV